MPNVIAVPNPDGTVGGAAYNEWADPAQYPVVQEPVTPAGEFELKKPAEKEKPKTRGGKAAK